MNKIVDSLIHPLIRQDLTYVAVDAFIHALVERSPPETIQKFIKYSLPKILRRLTPS